MATTNGLPKFLGVKHLKQWLKNSPDGMAILAEAAKEQGVHPAEWLAVTPEGQSHLRELVHGAMEASGEHRVLVVVYGNGEIRTWADGATVKVVNVQGDPRSRDLTREDVGWGWFEMVDGPLTIRRGSGEFIPTGVMILQERVATLMEEWLIATEALKALQDKPKS